MDLNSMQSLAARATALQTAATIQRGDYARPAEHPRVLVAGRGKLRGSRGRKAEGGKRKAEGGGE